MVWNVKTADEFNDRYPVGVPVMVRATSKTGRTRARAFMVGERAVVLVTGIQGGVPLDDLIVRGDSQ